MMPSYAVNLQRRGWIYPNVAKAGALQRRGGKGEAVVLYCEPLTTKVLEYSGFPEGGKTWRKQT
jgi:hypothetical protein